MEEAFLNPSDMMLAKDFMLGAINFTGISAENPTLQELAKGHILTPSVDDVACQRMVMEGPAFTGASPFHHTTSSPPSDFGDNQDVYIKHKSLTSAQHEAVQNQRHVLSVHSTQQDHAWSSPRRTSPMV
jgi:hypothetical protein